MTPEQWQQLLSTLGETGSQIYAAAARQAAFDAALRAIVTLLLIAVITMITRKTVDWHRNSTPQNENEIFVFVSCVFLGFLALLTYLFAYEAIAYLVNPEWAVYETIASLMQ